MARDEWRQAAEDLAADSGRLLALWASRDGNGDNIVRAAFIADAGVLVLSLPLTAAEADYPGIEQWFPSASRMQRAVADLSGLRTTDADTRPWLRHAAWPESFHPLIDAHTPPSPAVPVIDNYAFVPVEGDGVHEIPVGPVHAGIIEPGHFRFSVVGEKVLRLEERLGYAHKRALSGASLNFRCSTVTDWRRAFPAILPSHFRGLIARRWKAWLLRTCPASRPG